MSVNPHLTSKRATSDRTFRAHEVVFAAAGAGLVITAAVVIVPSLHFAYRNPDLHVALLTAEALIALLCAYLVLGRFHDRRRLDDLMLCLAFVVISMCNLWFAAVPAVFASDTSVFSTWSALTGRLVGATLFAVAALVPSRRVRLSRTTSIVLCLGLAALLGSIAIAVGVLEPYLPRGVPAGATPESSAGVRLEGHPAVLAAQLVAIPLYAAAAVGFTIRAERAGDRFAQWLAIGAVVAATARLNYFLYPSIFTEYVYTGDAFRLVFYVVVLVAAATEIRSYWRSAARAAVLEERGRIAWDLHDGLVQELAAIERNLHYLDRDDRAVKRARSSVERAGRQARDALAALSDSANPPLDVALESLAREVGEREGTRVVVSVDGDVRPSEREALLMIASEAITNAARHGGAELVRLEASRGPPVQLRIRDFGRGFDPAAQIQDGHYGLRTMRERAAALSGEVHIESQPGKGTLVEVII
jgi:signal transduction histidine kinase